MGHSLLARVTGILCGQCWSKSTLVTLIIELVTVVVELVVLPVELVGLLIVLVALLVIFVGSVQMSSIVS